MHVSDAVAIIGAGFIGAAVARALVPSTSVVLASRSGRPREDVSGARPVALDVTDDGLDVHALADADRLVIGYAPGRGGDRRALYVDGTRRLLERIGRPLRRVVWLGSTSAIADHDGWVDEDFAPAPGDERGRVQRDAEAVVFGFGEATGTPVLVLRLGGLYGPGRELDRIYAQRSSDPFAGHGYNPTNLVHRDDAVAAVVAALSAPAGVRGVVHVVDDDHTPRRRMYEAIARHRGVDPVAWSEPVPASAVPIGKRVSNARLKDWLGVRLQHPFHT